MPYIIVYCNYHMLDFYMDAGVISDCQDILAWYTSLRSILMSRNTAHIITFTISTGTVQLISCSSEFYVMIILSTETCDHKMWFSCSHWSVVLDMDDLWFYDASEVNAGKELDLTQNLCVCGGNLSIHCSAWYCRVVILLGVCWIIISLHC